MVPRDYKNKNIPWKNTKIQSFSVPKTPKKCRKMDLL
jgi:hypothetical protein